MIISFRDKRTRAFFEGERVKAFQGFERQAMLRLDRLHAADRLMALNTPGNRLEGLKGERQGQYSIRINEQWLSLAESEANVAALQARAAEYERRYAELRAAAGKVPEVEAEYTQLNRDYAVTKQNYEALVARRESAQLSGDMDSNAGVMDFRIIDPARVPLSPSFPNRPLLSSAVLLAGILGGIALAFVLSQVRPTFADRRSLREATGLPILGTVTMIWTEAQRARHKRNLTALAASYAGLLVSYGGVIATYAMLARAT